MSSTGILPESLQTALHQLIERVNACNGGIRVILLSTSEGVPLGRILSPQQDLDETLLENLESTWAPAPKQLALLPMNKVLRVTASYETATLMHLHYSPIVVTIVFEPNLNLGVIQSTAIPLLEQTLSPLCTTLVHSLSPSGEWQDGFYQ